MKKFFAIFAALSAACAAFAQDAARDYENPPPSAYPGVYWYFLDGNMDRGAMLKDLQSMEDVGISSFIFLEVDLGIAKGPVKFMSEEWQDNFAFAVKEAEKRGITVVMGVGPGWSGSGAPWVGAEDSMKHLVFSKVATKGPGKFKQALPVPEPFPLSIYSNLTEDLQKKRADYYEDFKVLAFPSIPDESATTPDINEKALYMRGAFSSDPSIKPYLTRSTPDVPDASVLNSNGVIDVTDKMSADGILEWDVPDGDWTIMRLGMRTTGANSRPAPLSGLGFETDKFDSGAFESHLEKFIGSLMKKTGKDRGLAPNWTTLHLDSWEMGAQNWTKDFYAEFKKRRGYDPAPYLPAMNGLVVDSPDITERFLWDLRKTAQELVVQNHAEFVKKYAHGYGMDISIEPYDMSFFGDMEFGSVADKPMAEFWLNGHGFQTTFSVIEATSIAHTMGKKVVPAESFTSMPSETWLAHPFMMKAQGDWAFCMGVNRIYFHTFAHQPLGDDILPGLTFGPHGVSWHRNQPWWNMLSPYHKYLARCSNVLQQGVPVSSVLYLVPDEAPFVFTPPPGAMEDTGGLLDKKSYPFDAVTPAVLKTAKVKDGKICFDGGAQYDALVLPDNGAMNVELLNVVADILRDGGVVVGFPPSQTPTLADYPAADEKLRALAGEIWGENASKEFEKIQYGKGRLYTGSAFKNGSSLYPDYGAIVRVLKDCGVPEDFASDKAVRHIHRKINGKDAYFLSNKSDAPVLAKCVFNVPDGGGSAELWNPAGGESETIALSSENGASAAEIYFEPYQSFFVFFGGDAQGAPKKNNMKEFALEKDIGKDWNVSFKGRDPMAFETLEDWTASGDEYIKYYSGVAAYKKNIVLDDSENLYLEFDDIKNIARVKLNGKELGILWTKPWRIELDNAVAGENTLEIEVANLWLNRIFGDMQSDEKRTLSWESGLLGGGPHEAGKYTFTPYTDNVRQTVTAPLPSGLIGGARIVKLKE